MFVHSSGSILKSVYCSCSHKTIRVRGERPPNKAEDRVGRAGVVPLLRHGIRQNQLVHLSASSHYTIFVHSNLDLGLDRYINGSYIDIDNTEKFVVTDNEQVLHWLGVGPAGESTLTCELVKYSPQSNASHTYSIAVPSGRHTTTRTPHRRPLPRRRPARVH